MSLVSLYAMPLACSLAVHLSLRARNVPFELHWVERFTHRLDDGRSYLDVNPKGRVPALVAGDGPALTEMVAVLFALEDGDGTASGHHELLTWLGFLNSELHKQVLFPTFDPRAPADQRADIEARLLPPVLAHLEARLADVPTLLGSEAPSVADFYLFWALTLVHHRWPDALTPSLKAFQRRMLARADVQQVLAVERAAFAQRSGRS